MLFFLKKLQNYTASTLCASYDKTQVLSSDFGPFRTPPCQCRAPQLNTCWRAKHLHLNKNALDFVGAFH